MGMAEMSGERETHTEKFYNYNEKKKQIYIGVASEFKYLQIKRLQFPSWSPKNYYCQIPLPGWPWQFQIWKRN